MFHPQFGYGPRLWQGFQPSQALPQPNFSVPPQFGSNNGPFSHMNVNQPRLPPNNNARWVHPPINPMIPQNHPRHFGPNFPQQLRPPGTDGEACFQMPGIPHHSPIAGQVSNPTAFTCNSQGPPIIPNPPILSPVHTSISNYPFSGQPLQNNQSLPRQPLNNSQPIPGQPLQNSQSFPGQLYHNTQTLSGQMFHNQASSSGQMNVFPGQISNPNLSLGNNNSVQVPTPLQPPLPPDPFPGQTLIHPPREPPMPTRSEKVPIKSRSKDINFSSRDAKTHNSPSKKNHSFKTDHSSRKEQVSPRKRKSNQSPSSTKHDSKRSRHNSESFRKKEHDHEDRSESNMKHNRNDLKISQRDRNDQSVSNRDKCKSSMSDVNNQRSSHTRDPRSDKHVARRQDSKQGVDDHHSSFSQSVRPIRSVSPPAPDIKRKIKFIVPEDLYQLKREGTPPRTIVTATQELQKIYQTFEKKVLNTPNEVETTKIKDLPGTHKACNTQDTANRIMQDNMELDSLDGNEFDVTESRPKGEYTEDVFGANDDTDDTDEDDNDSRGGDSSSDEECGVNPDAPVREYRQRKLSDPRRLHPDLWFNELGEGNDGPVCKCCAKDKEHGIRHAVYPGETDVPLCHPLTNNANKLHHYWVTVTPHCNFMTDRPTVIKHRDKDYVFEGFSIVSHEPLDWIPTCSFIRFNIEYTFHLIKEPLPKNFCIKGLELFSKFLFSNILELFDWTLKGPDKKGCPIFHFLPRFILHQNDKKDGHEIHELLSMDKVLYHLIKSSSEFVIKPRHLSMPRQKERPFAKAHYNNIVTQPNKKPAAFRIDDILFENGRDGKKAFPQILHHGIRPVQMCYAGNPKYQKLWKSYVRLRNTISNKPVASRKEHDRLVEIKIGLEKMKLNSSMRRDVEVRMSSEGLKKTGINSDVCQHAMVLPVLVHHLRYHICLKTLDSKLGYTFKDRTLLQLALTHPSYHLNFGMNPDQARNTLTNCGVKLPRYGDRKIHRMNTKKKGITQLIRVMANLGKIEENQSMIRHNERLEFLGDAVMEYMCSSHLYFMLPEESEGNLAIYRSALVQNSNLAILAKSFNLSDYMQYSHGPDLCKEEDLDHAMANCFEAILGAIFLEGGLPAATEFFTKMAFTEEKLRNVWSRKPKHPLQLQQPNGDRHLIKSSPVLQKLQEFEESIGIKFNHIRLLARAFTHPQVGFNNLTLGDNQRMEFLGDSVLQLVVSVYLYRHFPDHHEGHLTLLRSSLVNNRTQAEISRQLGMEKYINFGSKELKKIREKQLADVLEAFLAALYVDKGLKHIETFCRVCFFPRVEDNIVNQEWIDSKSQLQQCCLALRQGGKHPDLPVYKVLQDSGPSHHKKFQVGVYYKGKRVGTGEGHSLHVAEMTAAKDALASSYFPEMARQKHFLDGKHQEKRTRSYEPSKQREKPSEEKKTVQEPTWVEHE